MHHLGVAPSRYLQTRVSYLRTLFLRVLRLILGLRQRVGSGPKSYGQCYRLREFGGAPFRETRGVCYYMRNRQALAEWGPSKFPQAVALSIAFRSRTYPLPQAQNEPQNSEEQGTEV